MWYNLNKKAVISVQHELLKKQKLDGSAHRVDSVEPWPADWTWPGAVKRTSEEVQMSSVTAGFRAAPCYTRMTTSGWPAVWSLQGLAT